MSSTGSADAGLRIGVAHHFGWAVVVTADAAHEVVDRRRIELIEPGVATAPIHHEGADLDDAAVADLLAEVRAWPDDFPTDLATLRRTPYEAQADSVMYREILAADARARGWEVPVFDAKTTEAEAAAVLGSRADDVLHGPRARLGPPWNKDHRIALAATVVAAG
ncbi:MAG: hypothetical protein R8F63_09680 [Acidimicrobiales bacterium]|nr:hypothetical protein [Acidimicrobiales bacterium]